MRTLLILLTLLAGIGRAEAANWFVDNSVGSSGAGTSWAVAWKDFSNIVWASVAAGDTIFISGGTTTQTYSTTALTIAKSGGVGTPITITSGDGTAGHTGTAILDGTTSTTINTSGGVIDTNNNTNLIIQNLIVQNGLENCVYVHGVASGAVTIQSLVVHTGSGEQTLTTNATTAAGNGVLHLVTVPAILSSTNLAIADLTTPAAIASPTYEVSQVSGAGGTITMSPVAVAPGVGNGDTIRVAINARAFRVFGNTAGTVTIKNNTIDTPANVLGQTDGFFLASNTSGVVTIGPGNIITINNTDPSGHDDCLQSTDDGGLTVVGNLCQHPNGGVNNHGFILSDVLAGGQLNVYDNIIDMGSTPGTAINQMEVAYFRENIEAAANNRTGLVKFWNNTIYGGLMCYQSFLGGGATTIPANDEFKNNLCLAAPQTQSLVNTNFGNFTTPANTNFNAMFFPNLNLRAWSPAGTLGAIRSTTSNSAGLLYFEMQLGAANSGGDTLFGLVNGSFVTTNWVGQDTNSMGYWWSSGGVFTNGSAGTTIFTSASNDLIAVSVDFTHSKWWLKNLTKNTGWNNDVIGNQNPATNTGGISFAAVTGPYFLGQSFNAIGVYSILNVGSRPFVGTPPAGFSAWGAATTWDSAHASNVSVTTSPIGNINGTWDTYALWQAAGYDAGGLNSDPLLRNPSAGSAAVNYDQGQGSPTLNAGTTLGTVTTDISGVARPQGSAYDMGAFEHASRARQSMMGLGP